MNDRKLQRAIDRAMQVFPAEGGYLLCALGDHDMAFFAASECADAEYRETGGLEWANVAGLLVEAEPDRGA